MLKSKVYSIPLYVGKLIVIITDSPDDVVRKFIPSFDNDDLYACTCMKKYKTYIGHYVIFNPNDKVSSITHGVIAHECFHATNNVAEYVNLSKESSSDEATAYLIQWMVNKVYECFKKWGVKVA